MLFNQQAPGSDEVGANNVLVIRIQPDEGVSLRMQSKLPGAALRVEPVKMDFQYGASFGKASPEAYERLLHDAMSGDPTLFARRDEVEEAWQFVDVIEQSWHGTTDGTATADGKPAGATGALRVRRWELGSEGGRRVTRAGRPQVAAVLMADQMPDYTFSGYFENNVLRKRPFLRREWCIRVIENPLRVEMQEDARIRFWGVIEDLEGHYLR